MPESGKVQAGGVFLGEFVDVAVNFPPDTPGSSRVVAKSEELREFTVLLKDGRCALVRGHILRRHLDASVGRDVFEIVVRSPTQDTLVALFNGSEVAGIFDGEQRADRKIA